MKDGTVSRVDLNVSTAGAAVIAKIVQGTGISMLSTGADAGTGDVTITVTGTQITDDTTTNAVMYPVWVTANTGTLPHKVSSTKLTFNPSTASLGIGTATPNFMLSFGTVLYSSGSKLALYENAGADVYGFGVTNGSVDFFAGAVQVCAFRNASHGYSSIALGLSVGSGVFGTASPANGLLVQGGVIIGTATADPGAGNISIQASIGTDLGVLIKNTNSVGGAYVKFINNDATFTGSVGILNTAISAYGALVPNDTYFYSSSNITLMADGTSVIKFAAKGSTERMRLSLGLGIGTQTDPGTGNIGLMAIPSTALLSTFSGLLIGNGNLTAHNTIGAGGALELCQNLIQSSADVYKYISTAAVASLYRQQAGAHYFYTGVSGTAGTTATLASQLVIQESGVIIGNSVLTLGLAAATMVIGVNTVLSKIDGGSQTAGATTGAMTVTIANHLITITPTGACTFNAAAGTFRVGQPITFKITTSGTSSFVLTFGTNFKAAGTLATGTVSAKVFQVRFEYDGATWIETGRTAAM